MLSASYHYHSREAVPIFETTGAQKIHWIDLPGLVFHLYPDNLDNLIIFRDQLTQFIQETLHAKPPLSNGNRLDDSRDISLMPTKGF